LLLSATLRLPPEWLPQIPRDSDAPRRKRHRGQPWALGRFGLLREDFTPDEPLLRPHRRRVEAPPSDGGRGLAQARVLLRVARRVCFLSAVAFGRPRLRRLRLP